MGIPGIESASCTAGENGIHRCFLNLDDSDRNFDFLKLSKSNGLPGDDFIAAEAISFKVLLAMIKISR
jgi:hypothetical protein